MQYDHLCSDSGLKRPCGGVIPEMSCFEAKDTRADLTTFRLQVILHRHQRKAEVTSFSLMIDSVSLH
jgi:hypothetical protein